MPAPRIGITSNFDEKHQVYFSRPAYTRAIADAGGLPFLLPFVAPAHVIRDLLPELDGILLSGGTDLSPLLYSKALEPVIEAPNHERDTFELDLTRLALDSDIPILGICRGNQMLNVAAGGSLFPDIPSCTGNLINHKDSSPPDHPSHTVSVVPNTLLSRVVGHDTLRVNSWHHQAVRDVASGFRISAQASDGVIEAIESSAHRFALGIQWHPEHLVGKDTAARLLFAAFVTAASQRRSGDPLDIRP